MIRCKLYHKLMPLVPPGCDIDVQIYSSSSSHLFTYESSYFLWHLLPSCSFLSRARFVPYAISIHFLLLIPHSSSRSSCHEFILQRLFGSYGGISFGKFSILIIPSPYNSLVLQIFLSYFSVGIFTLPYAVVLNYCSNTYIVFQSRPKLSKLFP